MRPIAVIFSIAMLALAGLAGTAGAATDSARRAVRSSDGANGIVAIHTGSWGYREVVYGRGTTHWLATASYPVGVATTLISWAGEVKVPVLLAVYAGTMVYRAIQADNSGRCFAMVRPTWVPIYFAAVESWDCR